ncbi:MAG: hypothetical protein ACKESB_00665 [Candidatus Hodgkinia cicadicola]
MHRSNLRRGKLSMLGRMKKCRLSETKQCGWWSFDEAFRNAEVYSLASTVLLKTTPSPPQKYIYFFRNGVLASLVNLEFYLKLSAYLIPPVKGVIL